MATLFGTQAQRGCFVAVNIGSTANSRGSVLRLPGYGSLPLGVNDPMLVTSVEFQLRENVSAETALGGRTYLFAFGHDPSASSMRVSFLAFLHGDRGQDGNLTSRFLRAYRGAKVSASKRMARLAMPGNGVLSGPVVGLSSQTSNAELHLQNFTFDIMLP